MRRKSADGGICLFAAIALIAFLISIPNEIKLLILGIVILLIVILAINRGSKRRSVVQSKSHIDTPLTSWSPAPAQAIPVETSEKCWVPSGKEVRIKELILPGGMIYVGSNLPSIRENGIEPTLINPDLPFVPRDCPASTAEFQANASMPYWPNYSEISPEARYEYLNWLSQGRRSPVQIGCVFLFFYGLERRVLFDLRNSDTVFPEIQEILSEVKQLLDVYGTNGSFRRYATSFLEFLEIKRRSSEKFYSSPPPEIGDARFQISNFQKIALGQLALDQTGLPGEWAFSWLMSDPSGSLRQPARRCPELFRNLFIKRYDQKFPEGMKLPLPRTRLEIRYHPASASFGGSARLDFGDFPDVTALEKPLIPLRKIAEDACESLAPYSRLVGRCPDKKTSMDAVVLLPAIIWPSETVQSLRTYLDAHGIGQSPVVMSFRDLIGHFSNGTVLNREQTAALASGLESIGIGMEPDVRWGGPVPEESTELVLFAEPGNTPKRIPASFTTAALSLQICAAVSVADGLSDEEESYLFQTIDQNTALEPHERERLRARLRALLLGEPGLTALKKQVARLDSSQRRLLGSFALHTACLEGQITPAEMKILSKIYSLLGLPAESLFQDVHAAATEPVTIRAHAPGHEPGYRIPPRRKGMAGIPQAMDQARVEKLRAESAQVAELLGSIFVESEPEPQEEDMDPNASQETSLLGLDAPSFKFFRILSGRPRWTRAELEDLAVDQGIMLDGALERINETVMDKLGKLAIEGDDPLEMNIDVLKEIESS